MIKVNIPPTLSSDGIIKLYAIIIIDSMMLTIAIYRTIRCLVLYMCRELCIFNAIIAMYIVLNTTRNYRNLGVGVD